MPLPRSIALAALTLSAAAWLYAPRAAAAPSLPRLIVNRAPAASDCPDAASLADAVKRLMQRPALDPASADRFAPAFEIEIARSQEGYTATLQAGGRTRQLSDPGETCAELAEALALTLAILLDSDLPAAHRSPPPSPLPRAPVVSPRPRQIAPPLRWELAADVGAAETVGLLTPLSAALVGGVSLRFRSVSFGLGALYLPHAAVEFGPGTLDLWLAAATARACVNVLGSFDGPRFSVCGEPMLGAIHGEGSGYAPDQSGTSPWFALSAAALAEGPIAGPLGWSAQASFVVPLTLQRFTVEERQSADTNAPVVSTVVFDPFPVGLVLGLRVRLAIP